MAIMDPLSQSAIAGEYHIAVRPPGMMLTSGRNPSTATRAAIASAVGFNGNVPVPAGEIAGSSLTLRSEPGSGQSTPSFDFEHEVLKVVRAHPGNSGSLSKRSWPLRAELLSRFE